MQAHPLSSPAAGNRTPVFPPRSFNEPSSFPDTAASAHGPNLAYGIGLAHDAGNLLGALGLYCDLIGAPGVLRPEHRHYAHELRLLSQRSRSMIQRMLQDSSLPAQHTPRAGQCPKAVLAAIAPLLRSIAYPHATLKLVTSEQLPRLPFDAEILERILVNLTRNASSALRSPGDLSASPAAIRIEMRCTGACPAAGFWTQQVLRLTVADNGPGMPLAVAGTFFKPRPLFPGATRGFGHRIVQELLQATGGSLEIVVAPGRGTTLHMDWTVPAETPKSRRQKEATC